MGLLLSLIGDFRNKNRHDTNMNTIDYQLYLDVHDYISKYKQCFLTSITKLTVGDGIISYHFELKKDIQEYQSMYIEISRIIKENNNKYIYTSGLSDLNTFTIYIDMDVTNNSIYDLYKKSFVIYSRL